MSNNIELIKEGEFDNNGYELGIALKKLNIKLSKNNDNLLKKHVLVLLSLLNYLKLEQ